MFRLLLLQVLASCLWLGHSEVVKSFSNCPKFFYAGRAPNNVLNPRNPAWICQRYRNNYHFATLYDKDRRIPVYSAYIYHPGNIPRPQTWFVEPQLIKKNNPKEMETEENLKDQYHFTLDDIKKHQAIFDDYENLQGLDRGHLSPSGHQNSFSNKSATFSLTNIVPQDSNLNKGQWNVYETKTMQKNTQNCTITYVITGAVPGKTTVAGGRVNRPSYIWSAACCVEGTKPKDAWGAIAENNNNKVDVLRLGELERKLSGLYKGRRVVLFNNACPRQ